MINMTRRHILKVISSYLCTFKHGNLRKVISCQTQATSSRNYKTISSRKKNFRLVAEITFVLIFFITNINVIT